MKEEAKEEAKEEEEEEEEEGEELAEVEVEVVSSTGAQHMELGSGGQEWQCSACTLLNAVSAVYCAVCGQPRQAIAGTRSCAVISAQPCRFSRTCFRSLEAVEADGVLHFIRYSHLDGTSQFSAADCSAVASRYAQS
jgi:hypothetical protein